MCMKNQPITATDKDRYRFMTFAIQPEKNIQGLSVIIVYCSCAQVITNDKFVNDRYLFFET